MRHLGKKLIPFFCVGEKHSFGNSVLLKQKIEDWNAFSDLN